MDPITVHFKHKTKHSGITPHPGTTSRLPQIVPCIVFLFSFLLSFIAGSLIIQPQASRAVDGLSLVDSTTIALSTSSYDVAIQLTPTSSGTQTSSSHILTTATNVPTGYNLSLETTNTPTLPITSGTITAPTTLSNNTWGYSLTGDTDSPIWAGATATPTTIKNTSTSTPGDDTTIYYGAKADVYLKSDIYSNNIRYTAATNIANIPTPSITSIDPDAGSTAGGTQIVIVGTGFTVNDQSVTTSVNLMDDDGTPHACTDVSVSSNTPTTGQDTIYCTTPAHPIAARMETKIATWGGVALLRESFKYIAPTPTITAPSANQILNAGTTSTTLSVVTDMNAICYYGTTTKPTAQMTTTGGTTHSQIITRLSNASTNTRHVRCQAASGHSYGSETSVTFYVKTAMPAEPAEYRPDNGITIGAGIDRVNNIAAIVPSGVTCTYATDKGTLTEDGDIIDLTAGLVTISYSCTAGSGNTLSEARTGSWTFDIDTSVINTGEIMQTISLVRPTQCPAERTRVQDARDGATYWVGRVDGYTRGMENTETIYDAANPPTTGLCWMQTNLAYGGGGSNAYGDAKTINLNSTNTDATYTSPEYYMPEGSNRTTGTTNPSTSTDGTGQYGYLYNWCAAMGAQTSTSACANATTPAPNISISICPSGWRLPTSNTGGEFQLMTDTIGATTNGSSNGTTGSTALRSIWLGMYSGYLSSNAGLQFQGIAGRFWSASSSTESQAYFLQLTNSHTNPLYSTAKNLGFAVRCVAS